MRRCRAITGATALEMTSEPLGMLLTICAVAAVTFAAAFHIHQFGEPSRMARDAGFSVVLVGSSAYAVFCTIRAFRRELESGTLQMALSHPVSRTAFFVSKTLGAFLASCMFTATVFCAAAVAAVGAEAGWAIAAPTGDVSRIWGVSLSLNAATMVLPLVVGAVLNRFFRFRFAASAVRVALAVSVVGVVAAAALARAWGLVPGAFGLVRRMLPVAFAAAVPSAVFTAAAAAFSVKMRDGAAAGASGVLALASVPVLGNYYLTDALAKGGSLSWSHAAVAAVAAIPFVAGFLILGSTFLKGRDLG